MAAPSRGHALQLKSKAGDHSFRITSEDAGTVGFKHFQGSIENECHIGLKGQSSIKWNNGTAGEDHVLKVDGNGKLMFKAHLGTDQDLGKAAVDAASAVTTANSAETKASSAETKASSAETKAATAETKANNAEAKAVAANQAATTASGNATAAQTAATAAQTAATEAKSKTDSLASKTKTANILLKNGTDSTADVKNYYIDSGYDAESVHGKFYTNTTGTRQSAADVDIKMDDVKLVDVLQYAASLEQKIKELDAVVAGLLPTN